MSDGNSPIVTIVTARVAVIIPYFQREAGILRQAVLSVLAQDLPVDVTVDITIVDDSSPVPAETELAELPLRDSIVLTILKQPNGGPGAARNLGLARAEREACAFVAFLDSDDRWAPGHLANALETLGEDADLFFDDHVRAQHSRTSYMQDKGRLSRWMATGVITRDPDGRCTVDAGRVLQPFLEDCLAQTSTLVLRTSRLTGLRFDPDLRSLGEDLLFMLGAAGRARRVRLSDTVGVECGQGVNIYHSALSWDHPDAPMRFASGLLLWNRVAQALDLNDHDRRYVSAKIAGFRRGFAFIWTRSLLKRRRIHLRSIEMLRAKLGWRRASLLPGLVGAVVRRASGREAFPEH